jgi:hypothetical protein
MFESSENLLEFGLFTDEKNVYCFGANIKVISPHFHGQFKQRF